MYQPYYKKYKRIFLLDNSTNLRCLSGDNLTDHKVYSMVVIKSPGQVDSFVPYIGGQMFSKDVYAIEGDVITIEWKQNGFKTITKTFTVAKGGECPKPTRNEYMMVIDYDAIQVLDEKSGKVIDNYNLRINGRDIPNGQRVAISIDAIAQSRVEIYSEGYEKWVKTYDLRRQHQDVVYMRKKSFSYNFVLLSKNHEEIHIEYPTKGFLEECPIEGYRPYRGKLDPHKENWLEYKPYTRAIKITLSIIVAVALFIGVGAGWYLVDYLHKKEFSSLESQISTLNSELEKTKKTKPTAQTQVETKPDVIDWGKIVEYLDNNAKWERSAMEKFTAIQGLWDALNCYEFENILKYEEELKGSNTFVKLVNAIKANERSLRGSFCSEGDLVITISNYIGKVKSQAPPQNDKNKGNEVSNQDKWDQCNE